MTTTSKTSEKTLAAFIHLSTFSQVLIPLGNFIFPLLLWMAKRKDPLIDEHGKQALNFQLSIYLFSIFLLLAAIIGAVAIGLNMNFSEVYYNNYQNWIDLPVNFTPIAIYVMSVVFFFLCLLVLGIYGVITATIRASEGLYYKYPLSINFLSSGKQPQPNETKKTELNAETL